MARLIICGLLVLLLSACAQISPRGTAENGLKGQYIGQSIDSLVLRFGPPDKQHTLQSGDSIYFFRNEQVNEGLQSSPYHYKYTYKCNITAHVSQNGTVMDLSTESYSNHPYSGDGCNKLILNEWN